MNYTQTLEFLFSSLPVFEAKGATAYKPGLERITAFCRHIGNPQRNFFTIHVAGTNGKGSVSHIIASVLQQAGYRTGLFTSPHLQDFRERIRVDGEMIPKQKVVNFVDKHHGKMVELELSFFEMTAALAFDYFAQSDVEVAVIETGLGGRLDATNIIVPLVSVITNVGLDHTALLGDTLPKIAAEKAGIIKKSIPVVIGESDPRYNEVIEQTAAANKSKVIYAEQEFSCEPCLCGTDRQHFCMHRTRDNRNFEVDLDLGGNYQRRNMVTAAATVDFLHEETPLTISRRAFLEGARDTAANTSLMGRWQKLGEQPLTVCDTGHNPQTTLLRDRLRPRQGPRPYPPPAAARRPLYLHAGEDRTGLLCRRAYRQSRDLRAARRDRRRSSRRSRPRQGAGRRRRHDLHRRQHLCGRRSLVKPSDRSRRIRRQLIL